MNLATGSLTLLGFVLALLGIISKVMCISLLAPLFSTYAVYLVAANTCFLAALVVDRFQKS